MLLRPFRDGDGADVEADDGSGEEGGLPAVDDDDEGLPDIASADGDAGMAVEEPAPPAAAVVRPVESFLTMRTGEAAAPPCAVEALGLGVPRFDVPEEATL